MRRIHRRGPPAFLSSEVVLAEKQRLLEYLRRDPVEKRSRRDNLNDSLFFDPFLRRELHEAFDGTCAFCESAVEEFKDDDSILRVAHFRPLRFVRDSFEVDKDYYLWLAFEWPNLHAVCAYCDKAKGNRFPVKGKRADFLSTYDSINRRERRLLLDPCQDDPSKHLLFRCTGLVEPVTAQGSATIDIFDLNRDQLVQSRRTAVNTMFDELKFASSSLDVEFAHLKPGSPHAGALGQIWRRLGGERLALPPTLIRSKLSHFPYKLQSYIRRLSAIDRQRLLDGLRSLSDSDQATTPRAIEWHASSYDDSSLARPKLFFASNQEIRQITVLDFKVIDALRLTLPASRAHRAGAPCLMILGENSTGKSSILSAIALALIGRKESRKLAKFFPAAVRSEERDRLDQLDQKPMGVHISFHHTRQTSGFTFDPSTNFVGGQDQATIVLGYGPRRYFDPKKRDYRGGAAARVKTLFDPLATIPYPDEWLNSRNHAEFEKIAAALRVVLAMDDDDELLREGQTIKVNANGRSTSIEALSEGYRSVFTMTVDMLREFSQYFNNLEEAQGVVLIDEIETHLHPRWKMQVMTSLRRVLPKVQFIATTHDPLCLRGMDDGEVVVLQRNRGREVRQLRDLPSIRGMTAEQLLTSDYFGLASTADPGLELRLLKEANDYARRRPTGEFSVQVSEQTKAMLKRLSLGDTPSEQIMQAALERYLAQRESPDGRSRTDLRAKAVEEVVAALRKIP
ncbi:AAA family ATPase [Agrobacterium tumefaciens]|uniref:AAA family ATPase n=1 Tax=Agrobacterium tumefaciens TaxID=358 RepID=UPI0015735E87|nr:AAA family ATPase [Agrobacterium tumefaciens]